MWAGGAIVADELNLDTGELVVQDLNIYDESQDFSVGGGINLNEDDNSYGNVDYKDSGHIIEGEINSTIASNGGTITIGGKETSQEELEELGVNTDLDNLHIITKDEDWSIDLSVELLKPEVVAKQLEDSKNFIKAITTPVPDDVKASGPSQEDYYKRLTAQGFDNEEEIKEVLNTPEVQQFIKSKDNWNEAIKFYGGEGKVPENIKTLIASGKNLDFSQGEPKVEVDCNQSISKGCYLTIDVRAKGEKPEDIVKRSKKVIDQYVELYNKTKNPKKKARYAAMIEANIFYMELCSEAKGQGLAYAQAQGFDADISKVEGRVKASEILADARSPAGFNLGKLLEVNKDPFSVMEGAYFALVDGIANKEAGLDSAKESYEFENYFVNSMKSLVIGCSGKLLGKNACLKDVDEYQKEIVGSVIKLYEQGLLDDSFVRGGVEQFNGRLQGRVVGLISLGAGAGAGKLVTGMVPKPKVKLEFDDNKFNYIFGKADSKNKHNYERSLQLNGVMRKLGIHNNKKGKAIITGHVDEVLKSPNNTIREYSNQHGDFIVKEGLLKGPGGFVKSQITYQKLPSGKYKFNTIIPFE